MEPPDRDEAKEFVMIPRETLGRLELQVAWLNPLSICEVVSKEHLHVDTLLQFILVDVKTVGTFPWHYRVILSTLVSTDTAPRAHRALKDNSLAASPCSLEPRLGLSSWGLA
jgi:hypothetical protein